MFLNGGNILSIAISSSLDIFFAFTASADLSPILVLSISKNSWVLPLLALNPCAILSINLSILSFESVMFLFRSVSLLITLPVPAITPVNNAPSVPNLTLFNKSVNGSSVSLSTSVGPPIKSPNVPICSTSPTNAASPTPPPSAPPINLFVLPLVFNSKTSSANFFTSPEGLKYLPVFAAFIASTAILEPTLKPAVAGIPMLTNASVI